VVRYQVQDIDRAVAFYTQHLGFQLTQQRLGPIAIVSRGNLHLLLSGPGSSGSRAMTDGRRQEPGGWNRIVLYVESLDSIIPTLTRAAARFRNEVEVGPGGKQILVEDPDGNRSSSTRRPGVPSGKQERHDTHPIAVAITPPPQPPPCSRSGLPHRQPRKCHRPAPAEPAPPWPRWWR
jgi:glyoxylase I family protein